MIKETINTNNNNQKNIFILLFGGSKFMGLDFVEKIIKQKNENKNLNIKFFIVNRGNSYWNGKFFKLIEENKNWIYHLRADRNKKIEFQTCLKDLFLIAENILKEEKIFDKKFIFDFLVDFTSFRKKDIYNLFDFLAFYDKNAFEKYVFISTDSTYNASEISLEHNPDYFLQRYFNEDVNKN